jgi:SAM-dependent methyltransferase
MLLSLLHQLVPPSKEALVVDIGCGTGGNAAVIAQEYQCLAIDPEKEAIEYAQKKFPDVQFLLGTAPQDIPEEMKRADIVLLMDVLEHIEDDVYFVQEILASMKSGAHLIIMAPADMSLWSPHDEGFEHFRRYDLERFSLLWKGQPGISVRMAAYCNSRLYPLVKFARFVARLRKKPLGAGDSDLSLPSAPVNWLLEKIFQSEERVLLDLLDGKRAKGFSKGVSVLAVLTRETGALIPQHKPEGLR